MNKKNVISFFGGRGAVVVIGRLLGISSSSVSQWSSIIPERAALKLEKLTNGKLKYDASLYSTPNNPQSNSESNHAK